MNDSLKHYLLDKDFYRALAKQAGASKAITQLHLDTEKLEFEAFEGSKGYQPALVHYLEEVREFSRELWRTSIDA